MVGSKVSRRGVIECGLAVLPALALLPGIAKAAGGACGDASESLHKSLNYAEQSPDPQKTCSNCGFFSPDDGGGACGSCKIFNGPTNPKGHCDSWAAKG
jgi:hypothetical protein